MKSSLRKLATKRAHAAQAPPYYAPQHQTPPQSAGQEGSGLRRVQRGAGQVVAQSQLCTSIIDVRTVVDKVKSGLLSHKFVVAQDVNLVMGFQPQLLGQKLLEVDNSCGSRCADKLLLQFLCIALIHQNTMRLRCAVQLHSGGEGQLHTPQCIVCTYARTHARTHALVAKCRKKNRL